MEVSHDTRDAGSANDGDADEDEEDATRILYLSLHDVQQLGT